MLIYEFDELPILALTLDEKPKPEIDPLNDPSADVNDLRLVLPHEPLLKI